MIVSAATASAELSAGQKAVIGRKIWQNECAGTVDGLTSWNAGEEFPSLGIGHFIWYPAGFNGPFTESWPQLVAFAKQRGANPPAVASLPNCPWSSKKQFQAEFRGPQSQARGPQGVAAPRPQRSTRSHDGPGWSALRWCRGVRTDDNRSGSSVADSGSAELARRVAAPGAGGLSPVRLNPDITTSGLKPDTHVPSGGGGSGW